jgi:glutaredoxin
MKEPNTKCYTIYSKSGCINCVKVKQLLKDSNTIFEVIDCDEYLIENKEEFLDFMKQLIGYEYRMFPMVFESGKFIGGFNETNKYVTDNNKNNNNSKSISFDSDF